MVVVLLPSSSRLQSKLQLKHLLDLSMRSPPCELKPWYSSYVLEYSVYWSSLLLYFGSQFSEQLDASGFLPVILREDYFFDASRSYKTQPFIWSQSLSLTQDLMKRPFSLKYYVLRRVFMFIYFQIVEGHMIAYDLLRIVLLEFDIDQLDFF
jgi:hypothetical protein